MATAKGSLARAPFDHPPLEKAIDRHDAAAPGVSPAKQGELRHGFGARVDRLAPAVRVGAAVRDQAPAQKIERALARLVVFADHVKKLARRGVIGRRLEPAVRHAKPVNEGIAKEVRSLNDTAAHGRGR
jgi:hypothetical protein